VWVRERVSPRLCRFTGGRQVSEQVEGRVLQGAFPRVTTFRFRLSIRFSKSPSSTWFIWAKNRSAVFRVLEVHHRDRRSNSTNLGARRRLVDVDVAHGKLVDGVAKLRRFSAVFAKFSKVAVPHNRKPLRNRIATIAP